MLMTFLILIPLVALMLFKYLAIDAYKSQEESPKSWMAVIGKKLAMGGNIKFTIILTATILIYSISILLFATFFYYLVLSNSLDMIGHLPAIVPVSGVIFVPLILIGFVYISATDRGLSWWDAFRISFRFDSFHGRKSYLKPILEDIIEEAQEGLDNPHRAFLTLQRFFIHRFKIGSTAREMILDIEPELFHDLDQFLQEEQLPPRKSTLLLYGSVVFLMLSFALFVILLSGVPYMLLESTVYLFDTLSSITVVLLLSGFITLNLELPQFNPSEYQAKVSTSDVHEERTSPTTL